MKKRTLSLLLVLALSLALCGCGTAELQEALSAGRWRTEEQIQPSAAAELLASMDFYESEIALADLNGLRAVKGVEFRTDGTYRFFYDADATKALTRAYLESFLAVLAQNRAALAADYDASFGIDMAAMTEEEFLLFYAELFGCADSGELLDYLAASFYDYELLGEDLENGTYSLTKEKINCTIDGALEEEYLEYALTDGTLTLTYVDSVEVYTHR